MYQVTQSQTASNIKLIEIVKKYPQLYNSNDQNYKNTVFVESGWRDVAKEFSEPVADCKKKWRHLRSSLSRYLKSSKEAKNKNQRLKPYYLLNHMEFLIPYTKSLDMTYKNEPYTKYEMESDDQGQDNDNETESPGTSAQNSFTTMKPEQQSEHGVTYTTENEMDDNDGGMDEDESNIVYEAYEYPNQPKQPQQQQQHQQPQQQQQQLQQQTITKQFSTKTFKAVEQEQQQSAVSANNPFQVIPVSNVITDNEVSADLNFFMAILPDVKSMTPEQKRKLRIGVLNLIDNILSTNSSS